MGKTLYIDRVKLQSLTVSELASTTLDADELIQYTGESGFFLRLGDASTVGGLKLKIAKADVYDLSLVATAIAIDTTIAQFGANKNVREGLVILADALTTTGLCSVNDALDTGTTLWSASKIKSYIDTVASGIASEIHTPVQNIAALRVVSVASLSDKVLIHVEDKGLYRYDSESTATDDGDGVIQPTTGSGRWIKMSSTVSNYPGAGVVVSTGSAWGSSLSVNTLGENLIKIANNTHGLNAFMTISASNVIDLRSALQFRGDIGAEAAITSPATNPENYYFRGDKTFQILNTTAIAEGTNLYYTDTRTDARVVAGITGKVDKVSGKGLSTNDFTTDLLSKLNGIAAGAEVNVNADWNSVTGDSHILNKPSSFTPSAHTLDSHSNVTITDNASGEILKWNGSAWVNNTLAEAGIQSAGSYQPLATVLTNTTASFTTTLETKLNGIAAGAEVNVNADWNATSGDAQILNKPTLGTFAGKNYPTWTSGTQTLVMTAAGTFGVQTQWDAVTNGLLTSSAIGVGISPSANIQAGIKTTNKALALYLENQNTVGNGLEIYNYGTLADSTYFIYCERINGGVQYNNFSIYQSGLIRIAERASEPVSPGNSGFIYGKTDGKLYYKGRNGEHDLTATGTGMTYPGTGIAVSTGSAWTTSITNTTVGTNLLTLANPSAIRFITINANNTVTARQASDFLTDIGAVATSDGRLSDARTPLSHAHGSITNAGYLGIDANKPLITTTGGLISTGSFGNQANTFCVGNDSRLSDSRPASDVYTWAKQATKPSYTYSEVGAEAAGTMTTHQSTYNHGNYNTAYGWGNHASAGYLTSSSLSGYATQTWVGQQGFLTAIPDTSITNSKLNRSAITGQDAVTSLSGSDVFLLDNGSALKKITAANLKGYIGGGYSDVTTSSAQITNISSTTLSGMYMTPSSSTVRLHALVEVSLEETNSNKITTRSAYVTLYYDVEGDSLTSTVDYLQYAQLGTSPTYINISTGYGSSRGRIDIGIGDMNVNNTYIYSVTIRKIYERVINPYL